jgi:hypothetical protein
LNLYLFHIGIRRFVKAQISHVNFPLLLLSFISHAQALPKGEIKKLRKANSENFST